VLSFPQPLSFSSVLPKPLSETLTRSSDGRNPVKLTVGWCWQVGPLLVPHSGHASTYPDHCRTHNLSTLARRTHSLPRCPLQNGSPSQPRAHARAIASSFFPRAPLFFFSTSGSPSPAGGWCLVSLQPPVLHGCSMDPCLWQDALTAHAKSLWSGRSIRRTTTATVDVSSLHARACHIERGIRLDLTPIALFSPNFLVIPSNLGFRVHVVVFRSWRNAGISSGSMCTFRGLNCRNQLAILGSAIWEGGLAVENGQREGPFRLCLILPMQN
jgi:hypothetical protein